MSPRATGYRDGPQGLVVVGFVVSKMERDALGIPLHGSRFWVDEDVPLAEAWERSKGLLDHTCCRRVRGRHGEIEVAYLGAHGRDEIAR